MQEETTNATTARTNKDDDIMLPETSKIFPFTYLPFLPSSAQNQRDIDNQDY
jgi:hypothetical protein